MPALKLHSLRDLEFAQQNLILFSLDASIEAHRHQKVRTDFQHFRIEYNRSLFRDKSHRPTTQHFHIKYKSYNKAHAWH